MNLPARKPDWLRVRLPAGEQQAQFNALRDEMRKRDLHTVCEEARCPNIFECWGQGTATIMILGETCTRGCRFCAVNTGDPGGLTDPREPENTARALEGMGLAYVVMTMVDRDDLLDGGAAHVAKTVRRIKERSPDLLVETLVGDFQGVRREVDTLIRDGRPDVFAHNVEVVPRLQRTIRDVPEPFAAELDAVLDHAYGDGEWVVAFEEPFVYLSAAGRAHDGAIEQHLLPYLRAREGVARAYDARRIPGDLADAADPIDGLVYESVATDPPGDVFVVPAEGWFVDDDEPFDAGASHGTPYAYDREVAVLFAGPGVAPARDDAPLDQRRVARTIAALLGIEGPPNAPDPL